MEKPRFQFRLRSLLMATTIVAVGFGYWNYRADQQRRTVAFFKRSASVRPLHANSSFIRSGSWLEDYFLPVDIVVIRKNLWEEEVEALHNFRSLKRIIFVHEPTRRNLDQLKAEFPQCTFKVPN